MLLEWIDKIISRINDRLLDYRYKIPSNAGICFAYYLIMSVVPICSLCAYAATFLNIDLTVFETVLDRFFSHEMSVVIVQSLASKEIGWDSIIVIGISIFVTSRGIGQLYEISKNLFPPDHEHNAIIEKILTLLKTIAVFFLLIMMIIMLTFTPFVSSLQTEKNPFLLETYLFLGFFILMFLLYKIIPDVKVKFIDVVKGAATASFLMIVIIWALQIYFSLSNYRSIYGPLSTIFVVMLSFTFFAEVVYFGMYVMFEAHMKRLVYQMQREYAATLQEEQIKAALAQEQNSVAETPQEETPETTAVQPEIEASPE